MKNVKRYLSIDGLIMDIKLNPEWTYKVLEHSVVFGDNPYVTILVEWETDSIFQEFVDGN